MNKKAVLRFEHSTAQDYTKVHCHSAELLVVEESQSFESTMGFIKYERLPDRVTKATTSLMWGPTRLLCTWWVLNREGSCKCSRLSWTKSKLWDIKGDMTACHMTPKFMGSFLYYLYSSFMFPHFIHCCNFSWKWTFTLLMAWYKPMIFFFMIPMTSFCPF